MTDDEILRIARDRYPIAADMSEGGSYARRVWYAMYDAANADAKQ